MQESSNTLLGLDETHESAKHQKKWFLSDGGRAEKAFVPTDTIDSIKRQNYSSGPSKLTRLLIQNVKLLRENFFQN